MGLKSKFHIQHVDAYIMLLYYIIFLFTFFLLLRSPRDKFHNLKRLIRFNYNPPSIIITIFQTESFQLLNWKVSQLKCISLIKLTSTLSTLFLLGWNFFSQEKLLKWMTKTVHKKCTDKCTKSSFIVLIFMSVTGAQPEIFQSRGGLVGLGHFYKHFV